MGEMFGNGQHSYMQIPAIDVKASGEFYEKVFGWEVRYADGTDAHLSFSDTSGFIGAFVTGRRISNEAGIVPYIYVHGIEAAVERIQANGGEIETPIYPEGRLSVARFRDPAGNVMGIWQSA